MGIWRSSECGVENLVTNVPKIKLTVVSPAGGQLADPQRRSLKTNRNELLNPKPTPPIHFPVRAGEGVTSKPSINCTATGPSRVIISTNSPSPGHELNELNAKISDNKLGWLIPKGFAINPSSRRNSIPRVDILASNFEWKFKYPRPRVRGAQFEHLDPLR